MRIACVIAEYDPFHAGHAAMAQKLHAAGFDAVVAVMSGYYTQRGTPALLPPQVRAAAALACGVDLVLTMPATASAAPAPRFAAAGVAAAMACGADTLAFGAEDADLEALGAVCDALTAPAFAPLLHAGLDAGQPFFAARAAAAEQLYPGAAALLAKPNNILAIEYLLALRRLADIPGCAGRLPTSLALPRLGAGHGEAPAGGFASAGWLRGQPVGSWAPYVPAAALPVYQKAFAEGSVLDAARFETAVLTLLRTRTPADFAAAPDVAEGLDALLAQAVRTAGSLPALYAAVKSKRYTHARIRRLALAAALGWRAAPDAGLPTDAATACHAAGLPWLHAPAATAAGQKALAAIAKNSPIPISHSLARLQRLGGAAEAAADAEAAAADIYALCMAAPRPCGEAYRQPFLHG